MESWKKDFVRELLSSSPHNEKNDFLCGSTSLYFNGPESGVQVPKIVNLKIFIVHYT